MLKRDTVLFYHWPQGDSVGTMFQYVTHMLVEDLCAKFHFLKDNLVAEISCCSF